MKNKLHINRIISIFLALILSLDFMGNVIPLTETVYASEEYESYEPKNVMATMRGTGLDGLNISYINPSEALEKVSIYSVSEDDETLLSDKLSTSSNEVLKYTYAFPLNKDANDYKTYNVNFKTVKLKFDFCDGTVREVYVSGGASEGYSAVYHKGEDETFVSTGTIFSQRNAEMPMAQVTLEPKGAYSGTYAWHLKTNEPISGNYFAQNARNVTIRWENQNKTYIEKGFKYRVSVKIKGSATGSLYIRDPGAPYQVGAKLDFPQISDTWQEISADYTATEPFKDQIDFVFWELTQGDLWLDDLKLELYDSDGKTIKETVYNDSFEVLDKYKASDPKVVSYKTDTDTVLLWTPYDYSAYTDIYEELGGKLYLRARLPNFGDNAKTKLTLTGTDKKYVVQSESGALSGNNIKAVGGAYIPYVSGTCSDGVVPSEYSKNECIKMCDEVQELLKACENIGISTDYETADYTVMQLFTDYLDEEYLVWDNVELANKYKADIAAIYERVNQKLKNYLDGSEEPLKVPELSNNALKTVNGHQYDENGNPIITVGFNDFLAPNDFPDKAKNLGLNFTQRGLYIGKMIKYDEETDSYIPMGYDEPKRGEGYDHNIAQTIEFLDKCRKNNIKVNLIFEPMSLAYVPDADFRDEGVTYYGYISYNATHPRVKQQVDAAAKVFINIVKDYQDVVSGICFANEPYFLTNNKPYYDKYWTEYLKKKYPTPNELYSMYGTYNYDEVKRYSNDFIQPQDVLYRDYRDFNENVLCEYFSYMSDALNREKKEQGVTADIPLSIKLTINVGEMLGEDAANGRDRRRHGVNYEKICKLVDVNGIDTGQSVTSGTHMIESMSMWRDYVTSVTNRMISDTELHVANDIGVDSYIDYPEKQNSHTRGVVWQSAIQGADEMALWFFGRNERSRNSYANASFLLKPEELAEFSKTALDIRRLSKEITAVQDAKREVAILWSDTAYTFSYQMSNVAFYAYKACRDNGERPLFVTESTLDRLAECKLLLVPGCINISKAALNAINNFGGKVVLLGDNKILSKNEDDKESNSDVLTGILRKSERYSLTLNKNARTVAQVNPTFDADSLKEYVKGKLKECGLLSVCVLNQKGESIKDVEWTYAKDGEKMLINIYNKSDADISDASVYIDGVKIPGFSELISNKECGSVFGIKAYEAALLSVTIPLVTSEFSLLNTKDNYYKASIEILNISDKECKVPRLIAATYKDNTLCSVHISDVANNIGSKERAALNILNIEAMPGEEIKLMLFDDLFGLQPLKAAVTKEINTK